MYKQLTSEQRYSIYSLLQNKVSKKDIARTINVSTSTIYRELRRNSGVRGKYNWKTAQENARRKRCRAPGNHAKSQEVRDEAIRLLREEQWSPKQISAVLRQQDMRISHETMYRLIRKDKRDGGDFEMDTIVGKGNQGAIVTITERSTGMLLMRKLNKGKNARELAITVVRLLEPFKPFLKTITTDNGTEFACHGMITKALNVLVYFADPYSSWQKGAIENQNGLIRQYMPKSAVFQNVSHQFVTAVMDKINRRPRERLNFSTH